MVYETKTFEVLHRLTPESREKYQDFLEQKANEILFRHEHPVRWFFQKIKDFFNF